MQGSKSATDFDIVQNRINIALARSQRLVASWSASSAAEKPTKTEEQLQKEEEELFKPEPPRLGVGAPIPKEILEGDARRLEIRSNAKLRRLLGNKGSKPLSAASSANSNQTLRSLRRPRAGDDSEEEEGRSALGKMKRRKTTTQLSRKDTKEVNQSSVKESVPLSLDSGIKDSEMTDPAEERLGFNDDEGQNEPTRHATFLDQTLAEKDARKRRKGETKEEKTEKEKKRKKNGRKTA